MTRAHEPEAIHVVHQERWNCSPFHARKGNEHESYDMDEDDFCRRPVKQCGNSSRGSGTQGGGGTISQQNGKTCGRTYDRWILKLLAVFVVAACAVIQGQSPPRQRIDPGLATLGGGFVSDTVQVNGNNSPLCARRDWSCCHSAAWLPRRLV